MTQTNLSTDDRSEKNIFAPLLGFALSGFLIIIVLPLLQHGMDGVIYAAIAKNMSLGQGSLWQPFYSQTLYPAFYEHPPLAIYFQSLFFKFLGEGYGVERLYCFLMALGQISILAWYWITKQKASSMSLALLLIIWLAIPLNHLYVDNLLESSLILFTTLSALLLVRYPATFLLYICAAIGMMLGFLCNGPTALFPIAIPFLKKIFEGRGLILRGAIQSLLLLLVWMSLLAFLFLIEPASLKNIQQYLDTQLFASVVGERHLKYTGLKHLNILVLYIRAFGPVFAGSLVLLWIAARVGGQSYLSLLNSTLLRRDVLLMIAISLVASLPVGISHRQSFNYTMQSAPFFCLAMMYTIYEPFKQIAVLISKHKYFNRIVTSLSFISVLVTCCLLFNHYGGYKRDAFMLRDIKTLTKLLSPHEVLSVSPELYYNWYTGAYFARYSMVSVTTKKNHVLYLAKKNDNIPSSYQVLPISLNYYQLAEKS